MIQTEIENNLTNGMDLLHLEVENESPNHNVEPGSESHFKVVVVSENFVDLGRLHRHQQINMLLADELEGSVHALSIHAFTSEEWSRRNGQVPDPPNCISK